MRVRLSLAALAAVISVGGLTVATSMASAAPTPSTSIIAGTGTSGFNGDGGPATAAQLGQLNGLTVDPSGDVDVLDGTNRRVRQINPAGNISTIVGDGSSCITPTSAVDPLVGMCPNLGIAVDATGTVYYGDNAGISDAVSGSAYHYAGDFTNLTPPHDDGPKYSVIVSPADITIDPVSGNVTYNENHSIRAVVGGSVTTLVGNPDACNPVTPANGQTALGTCYSIGDLAFAGDDSLYFTDVDAAGNDYICVMKNGIVNVVAGNGTYNDSPTDGPALGTGLPTIRAITVAPDGTIFVAGPSRGRIWRITPDGNWSFVTEFQGGVPFLASDASGNVYAALSYTFQVAKLSGYAGGMPVTPPTPTPTAIPTPTISPTPTPTTTPTTTPPAPTTLNWVALGDSYSSGEGNPPFIKGSDTKIDKCHRSLQAYPEVVAQNSNLYTLSFHACSGAVLGDMYSPNSSNVGEVHPQLDWINANTSIITLTIGGNDAHFADVMGYCAIRTAKQPTCQKKWSGTVDPIISGLSTKYSSLLGAMHFRAPNAKIYLIGYPRMFPVNPPATCNTGVGPAVFGQSDMGWINSEINKVDIAIQNSAQTSGAYYVDTFNLVGTDHDLCSDSSWINHAIPSNKVYSYHPNAAGHFGEAQILEDEFFTTL